MHFRCWRPHSFISCVQNTWWWVFVLIGKDVTGILGYRLLKSLVIRSEKNNLPIDANRIGSIGSSIGYDWWVRAQNAFLLSAFTVIVERGFSVPFHSPSHSPFHSRVFQFLLRWEMGSIVGNVEQVKRTFSNWRQKRSDAKLFCCLFVAFRADLAPNYTLSSPSPLANKVPGSNYHSAP